MRGPPPLHLALDVTLVDAGPATSMVTGCAESMVPEFVRASKSKAASGGTPIVMPPDEE